MGHLRPCRHLLLLFAAQMIGKKKWKKSHVITTEIFNIQMFDKVWNHLYHLILDHGKRLLGSNPFVPDQCYYYATIFPDYIMTSLTFPDSAKMKLLPDFSWQHKPCVMFSLFQKYLITYLFKQSSILKVQDKICLENILYVSKPLNNLLLSVFHIWFSFSSDQHNYETSSHM